MPGMMRRSSSDSYEGQTEADMGHLVGGSAAVPDTPRRGRSGSTSASAAKKNSPFYKAASNPSGTTTQLYFQAKYYGPCPEISVEEESPVLVNVLGLMADKKAAGKVLKCNL
jgi:hypothetical protein